MFLFEYIIVEFTTSFSFSKSLAATQDRPIAGFISKYLRLMEWCSGTKHGRSSYISSTINLEISITLSQFTSEQVRHNAKHFHIDLQHL